jgi:hypothetical protein
MLGGHGLGAASAVMAANGAPSSASSDLDVRGVVPHDPTLGMGYGILPPDRLRRRVPAACYVSDEYPRRERSVRRRHAARAGMPPLELPRRAALGSPLGGGDPLVGRAGGWRVVREGGARPAGRQRDGVPGEYGPDVQGGDVWGPVGGRASGMRMRGGYKGKDLLRSHYLFMGPIFES